MCVIYVNYIENFLKLENGVIRHIWRIRNIKDDESREKIKSHGFNSVDYLIVVADIQNRNKVLIFSEYSQNIYGAVASCKKLATVLLFVGRMVVNELFMGEKTDDWRRKESELRKNGTKK